MNGFGAIIAFVIGWFISQFTKLIIGAISKKGHLSLQELLEYAIKSGGMPSGHTASFVALSTYLGLLEGFNSPIFALAACTTAIFVYDAVNVRRAVGEYGRLLKVKKPVEGHTVPQVIVGGLLGIGVGLLSFAFFQ